MRCCALCGVTDNIEGCHVKPKINFDSIDISNGTDRHMNIIDLCRKHHNMFDAGNISIADMGKEKQLVFVRWMHCCNGYCISVPVIPLRVNYGKWGGNRDKIKPEYIRIKNNLSSVSELIQFTSKIPPLNEYTDCVKMLD